MSSQLPRSGPCQSWWFQNTNAPCWLARRKGSGKGEIRRHIQETFGYNLDRTLDEIRPGYTFDVTCQGSVPEAIIAFLESEDFEDAVRKAVSLGGDSDTIACMTGGIAQAFYGEVPGPILRKVREILDPRLLGVVDRFSHRFP